MGKNHPQPAHEIVYRIRKIVGGGKVLADMIGVCHATADKYARVPVSFGSDDDGGSGRPIPWDRMRTLVKTLYDEGCDMADVKRIAMAREIVKDLAADVGCVLVPEENQRIHERPDGLAIEALRLAKETGDVEGAVCRALCDGHVDEGERQEIVQQCREAVAQIQQVIRAAQSQPSTPPRLHS